MAIFAVMAVMAYGGLDQVLRARDASEAVMDRLARLQLAWSLIGRDLEQAMPRPIRDGFGDFQAAFVTGGDNLFELTHGGWPNPLRRPRGHLQRVAYRLDGDKLQRLSWSVLDRAQDSEPRVTELLDGVEQVDFRILLVNGDWVDARSGDPIIGDQADAMPRAAELRLEVAGLGAVSRLFQVSGWDPEAGQTGNTAGSGAGQGQPGEAGDSVQAASGS